MRLVNASMLVGLVLVGVPILLHLLMKAKPKHVVFPALQLILSRKKNNQRRLRIRHWWLLFLRMLVIALLVLAIARPKLPAANYQLNFRETLTLLGILMFGAVGYILLIRRWKQNRLPNHLFKTKRIYARLGIGAAILFALAGLVAWPYQQRIVAEMKEPVMEDLPVAAVYLFDTSVSMEYQFENQTRLEQAQELVRTHLDKLPVRSKVAIGETSGENELAFHADLLSARTRLNELKSVANQESWNQQLFEAIRLHEQDAESLGFQWEDPLEHEEQEHSSNVESDQEGREDQFLREIYLLTDLSKTSWKLEAASLLKERLVKRKRIHLYLIDVGVEKPQNRTLTQLKISNENPLPGETVTLETTLKQTNLAGETCQVELLLNSPQGELVTKEKQSVTLEEGTSQPVSFPLTQMNERWLQGEVRIKDPDPLEQDQVQFFTIQQKSPPPILIVSESLAEAFTLQEVLAPEEFRKKKQAPFDVTFITPAELSSKNLGEYHVVCLVNVVSPSEEDWHQLHQYVEEGGGLAIFLGTTASLQEAYNVPAALHILPVERIRGFVTFTPPEQLEILQPSHDLFRFFQQKSGIGTITGVDFFRVWGVDPHPEARRIAQFTDSRKLPAILERNISQGRVLLITSGIDLVYRFSDLPVPGSTSWAFVPFAHRMMISLGGEEQSPSNFTMGSEIRLLVEQKEHWKQFLLRKPNKEQSLHQLREGESHLSIKSKDARTPGNYQVLNPDHTPPLEKGFSLNLDSEEANLTKLTKEELTVLFGEDTFRMASSPEDLDRIVASDRIGMEVFPLLLTVLLVFFGVEHLVANTFYRAEDVHVAEESPLPETSPSAI